MGEKIYTIPVNEAFDKSDACPFCSLYDMLEKNEIDIILGASMMEPDIRIQTNKKGFCKKHYKDLIDYQKRLPLALVLESHLDGVFKNLGRHGLKNAPSFLNDLEKSCYVCDRVEGYFDKMLITFFNLFSSDENFRNKVRNQTMFCLPHFKTVLEKGQKKLTKKESQLLYDIIMPIEMKYLENLRKDLKWFIKKFDYRFNDEPWYNSKDSVERVIYTLTSQKRDKK